jgi:hypothetical protein
VPSGSALAAPAQVHKWWTPWCLHLALLTQQ